MITSHDATARLTGVSHGAGVVEEFVYALDASGNRVGVVSSAGSEVYVLDALSRLTDVTYPGGGSESFGYDAAGNRVSHSVDGGAAVASVFDPAGQLVSTSDGVTYNYDDAGNLTSDTDGGSFGFDAYNRVTTATANGVTQTYGYDGDNVRVDVDGTGQVWDRAGGLPQLISDGSDAFLQPNGQYLATVSGGGTSYGLSDGLGSVRVTTNTAGAVTGAIDYSVFGETRSGAVDTFGYTGEQTDPTGLIHLRARQYDPAQGGFLSVDSAQPNAVGTGGWNLYTYAANNPTTATDPSGNVVSVEYSVTRAGAAAAIGGAVSLWTCDRSGNGWWKPGIPGADINARCAVTQIAVTATTGGFAFASSATGFRAFLQLCGANASVGAVDAVASQALAGDQPSFGGVGLGATLGCFLGSWFDRNNLYQPKPNTVNPTIATPQPRIDPITPTAPNGLADDIVGLSDDYIDITAKNSRVRNVQTSVGLGIPLLGGHRIPGHVLAISRLCLDAFLR